MRTVTLRANIVARIWVSEDEGDEGGGGGTTPAWLPDGALAFADFDAEHFYGNGQVLTLNTMFVENVDLWSSWDGTYPFSNGNVPVIAPEVAALLLDGVTFVMSRSDSDGGGVFLFNTDYSSSMDGLAEGSKTAITIDLQGSRRSVDGATVVSVISPQVGPYEYIGLYAGGSVSTIVAYPPVPDADLPALSSLS